MVVPRLSALLWLVLPIDMGTGLLIVAATGLQQTRANLAPSLWFRSVFVFSESTR
jgi:hypothetical protein